MFASSSLAENANGELFLMKYAKAPSMVYQLPCPGRTVCKTTATAASGSNGAIAVPRLSTTPGIIQANSVVRAYSAACHITMPHHSSTDTIALSSSSSSRTAFSVFIRGKLAPHITC
eukprot:18314-Heterococcus_DN1.PRE.2